MQTNQNRTYKVHIYIITYRNEKSLSTIDSLCKYDKNKEENTLTIHIVGQEDTGKTSLVIRISKNKFESFYIPSINIETTKTRYFNAITNEKKDIVLMTYNFNNFDPHKIKHEDFVFVIFDESNVNSFKNSMKFILDSNNIKYINKERCFFVGNKNDLKTDTFPENKFKSFCIENEIYFYEISVKTSTGVKQLLNKVCTIVSDVKELNLTGLPLKT